MRCGGRCAPRSVEAEDGDLVRRAQSRGEWPGDRMTFLLLRDPGGWVEVEGAREAFPFGDKEFDGARSVDAADGGNGARRAEAGNDAGGGGRHKAGFGAGRGGGSMEVCVGCRNFCCVGEQLLGTCEGAFGSWVLELECKESVADD